MNNTLGFDHLIGEDGSVMDEKDIKTYQAIMKSRFENQPVEERWRAQHIGLRLEMEHYLNADSENTRPVGYFLEGLLKVYGIKKSEFAAFIGMERTNFMRC